MEVVDGPWFDGLSVGDRFGGAPSVTLTSGHAAVHQAVLGDRLRLPLDDGLARAVSGSAPLAHPALVWDVAIGQSTVVTRQVRANLFYRGLAFHRFPVIGDTLRTVTEVVGLKENSRKPGRAPTGLAALRITTVDQEDRPVLDFWRCAMLPLRSAEPTGHADDLSAVGEAVAPAVPDWDLAAFRARVPGEHADAMTVGRKWRVPGGDVVSGAPELARLTVNIATTHHAGDPRLVYGGHTIGVALAQVCRAIPNIVTVVAWESCDHLGPVHEGDTLTSEIEVLAVAGHLVTLRSVVDGVLDWRYTVVMA
ncbi:MaoC family dehydratase [Actinophytocola algeriensis]|uniref:Acyl dehydratase n=1 Tax=Actinophytocola algeriensis TaxID=1768010 RepID=A0A7W7QA35_9PSEU|nr:MaoC family dehydratase [Actinophytocola algeriensis]MBB4909846.1 acyl dehydratase [Actinophytocola algeriensis]MBE1475836.1 acyl dehydratase [Actinophytocola algeriensis]